MKKLQHKLSDKQMIVCEMMATDPYMTSVAIAEKTGLHKNTIDGWRKHPVFIDAVYDRYMEIA